MSFLKIKRHSKLKTNVPAHIVNTTSAGRVIWIFFKVLQSAEMRLISNIGNVISQNINA
jgi:hypothetical protein